MPGVIANAISQVPLLALTMERDGTDELFRRFVAYSGARAGVGDVPCGVCRERSTTDGQAVVVDAAGVVLVVTGAAVALGAEVGPDAQGRAVPVPRPVLHLDRATGAAANTDIAVPGIALDSEIVDAYNATTGAALTGLAVHSAGNVRTTASTTGEQIIILWRPPARPAAGRALAAAAGADQTIPVLLGVEARAY